MQRNTRDRYCALPRLANSRNLPDAAQIVPTLLRLGH